MVSSVTRPPRFAEPSTQQNRPPDYLERKKPVKLTGSESMIHCRRIEFFEMKNGREATAFIYLKSVSPSRRRKSRERERLKTLRCESAR